VKKKPPVVDEYSARRFPVQHESQKLEDELNAINERIAELKSEGHRGHAMELLKAKCHRFGAADRRTTLRAG
jgi:hypothetical protein